MFPNIKRLEQHYEENLPDEAKEVDRIGQATLARVEKMKAEALIKFGYYNPKYGQSSAHIDNDKLFPIGKLGASDNAPKLKLGEIMAEKALTRELLRIQKAASALVSKIKR